MLSLISDVNIVNKNLTRLLRHKHLTIVEKNGLTWWKSPSGMKTCKTLHFCVCKQTNITFLCNTHHVAGVPYSHKIQFRPSLHLGVLTTYHYPIDPLVAGAKHKKKVICNTSFAPILLITGTEHQATCITSLSSTFLTSFLLAQSGGTVQSNACEPHSSQQRSPR
jgi:hypothetical protein